MTDDDFIPGSSNLGDRIRARRDANRERILGDLKDHIDEHFKKLHARLDELNKP